MLIDAGTVIETVSPICIVTGKSDRPAAFVLVGFCAVTALGYHQFWTCDDLRAPGNPTLTIIANALRVAHAIEQRMGG